MANTFKNAHLADVGTSYTQLYVAPASTTTVILGIALCNITSATVVANLQMRDAGANERQMLNDVEIPAGSTLEVLAGQKYILETTDEIRVKSDTANGLDVVMGIMEIT